MNIIEAIRLTTAAENCSTIARVLTPIILRPATDGWIGGDAPLLRGNRRGEKFFCDCSGRPRYASPPGGWREVVCIVGRQAGKTRFGSKVVSYEGALSEGATDGELYALLIAQDARASQRTSFSYIRGQFDASDLLRSQIVCETADTLDLQNGVRVACYPWRSVTSSPTAPRVDSSFQARRPNF